MNRWLQWYDADHLDGLRTTIAEGPAPKLTELQRATLTVLIERGPIAAGVDIAVDANNNVYVAASYFLTAKGQSVVFAGQSLSAVKGSPEPAWITRSLLASSTATML